MNPNLAGLALACLLVSPLLLGCPETPPPRPTPGPSATPATPASPAPAGSVEERLAAARAELQKEQPDFALKAKAAREVAALGAAGAPAGPDLVRWLYWDKDPELTAALDAAFTALGPQAVPALVAGLSASTFQTRERCAQRLLQLGPEATKAGLEALSQRVQAADRDTRVHALQTLPFFKREGAQLLPVLRRLMREDRELDVLEQLPTSLAAIGSDAAPALPELVARYERPMGIHLRLGLETALEAIGTPSLQPMVTTGRKLGPGLQAYHLYSLLKLLPGEAEGLDALLEERLRAERPEVAKAACALVELQAERAAALRDPLVKLLAGHADLELRVAASRAFAVVGGRKEDAPLLRERFGKESRHELRVALAQALASCGEEGRVALRRLTREGPALARLAACEGLAASGEDVSAEGRALVELLQAEQDASARARLLEGIAGLLPEDEQIRLLAGRVGAPESRVAVDLLGNHMGPRRAEALVALVPYLDDREGRTAGYACGLLEAAGPEVIAPLGELLTSGSARARGRVVRLARELAVAKRAGARGLLERAEKDQDPEVRAAATKALASLP